MSALRYGHERWQWRAGDAAQGQIVEVGVTKVVRGEPRDCAVAAIMDGCRSRDDVSAAASNRLPDGYWESLRARPEIPAGHRARQITV